VAANLTIDLSGHLGKQPKLWADLAQGGEENKPMLGPAIDKISDLSPGYIRLDHIYDFFDVVKVEGGQVQYNWSGLDRAVGEITMTGAKPMLVLSYMPLSISSGSITDPPRNWSDWQNLVRATIEHYSGRGNKAIGGVIYEVWNEPDLFGSFKTYGPRNYLTMYQYAAQGAMQARDVLRFEIGGPAITNYYANWIERLINYADENKLRLDFVSWHRYSLDVDSFAIDIDKARQLAERIPALVNLKFYLTEWGHNSANDSGYDTTFGAIHNMAVYQSIVGKVDRAFSFEIKDGPGSSKYWGRWGMLTHENFGVDEKPRYKALRFLNNLYQFRLGAVGQGTFVRTLATTNEAGDVRLLLTNFDTEGRHFESVPILFDNLPKREFSYKRIDFLGGSNTVRVATSEAVFASREGMGPNSAAIIELDF